MPLSEPEQHALTFVQRCLAAQWVSCNWDDQTVPDLTLVAGLARQQKVEGLLYQIAQQQPGLQTLVAPLLPRWQQALHLNTVRNLLLQTELLDVLSKFANAGIAVITLKGWAQIARLYPNAGVRPTADIDLLIARDQLEPAVAVLQAAGYTFADGRADLSGLAYKNEIALVKEGVPGTPKIELHWHLFDTPYWQAQIDIDWMWQTQTPVQLAGQTLAVLSPDATFLYECSHMLLHHTGKELKWLTDLGLLVQKCSLDWPLILKQATQFSLMLPLQKTCSILQDAWQVPIPATVRTALDAYQPSRAEREQFGLVTEQSRNSGQQFIVDLVAIGNIGGALRFARENLFPTVAYMQKRYDVPSGWRVWASYPYRWALGIWQLLQRKSD